MFPSSPCTTNLTISNRISPPNLFGTAFGSSGRSNGSCVPRPLRSCRRNGDRVVDEFEQKVGDGGRLLRVVSKSLGNRAGVFGDDGMFVVRNRDARLPESGDLRVLFGVDAIQRGLVDEEFDCGGSWRRGVGRNVVVLCVHGNARGLVGLGDRVAVRVLVETNRRHERPGIGRIFEIVKR